MAELLAAAAADEEVEKVSCGTSAQDLHRPASSGIDGDEHWAHSFFVTVLRRLAADLIPHFAKSVPERATTRNR